MSRTLEEQFEIQQLLYRYADAADRRDAEAYSACFVDGQVMIQGPGFALSDAGEIMRLLGEHFDGTMHNVHNHLHSVEGERASGVTYCVASHWRERDGQRTRLDMYIRYQDELRRTAQGWTFVSRHLQVGSEDEVRLSQ